MRVDFARAQRAGFRAVKSARYLPRQPHVILNEVKNLLHGGKRGEKDECPLFPPSEPPRCVWVNICAPGADWYISYYQSLGIPVCTYCLPIGGGGPPDQGGGGCGCDYNNFAWVGGGVDSKTPVKTSVGTIDNPCNCKLKMKQGAGGGDLSKPDACCYVLDCGKQGKFDIFNSKVGAYLGGCGGPKRQGCLNDYSQCLDFCLCISAPSGGASSIPTCYHACADACGGGDESAPVTDEDVGKAGKAVIECFAKNEINIWGWCRYFLGGETAFAPVGVYLCNALKACLTLDCFRAIWGDIRRLIS